VAEFAKFIKEFAKFPSADFKISPVPGGMYPVFDLISDSDCIHVLI